MNERAIFEAALEIEDIAARAAYLRNACAGQPELHASLEALFDSHGINDSFLEQPIVKPLLLDDVDASLNVTDLADLDATRQFDHQADRSSASDDQAPDLSFLQPSSNPDSIGKLAHYDIISVIGHGAFGIVLKAFDEKLRRHVAIKVLNTQLAATSPPRKRFLREARASAAIRHDNVVQVYYVEEQPLPYLVMELIEGETLQQKLRRQGPLEIPEMLSIGRQIALGLAAAHAQGLIHRDIKPANILIENLAAPLPSTNLSEQTVLASSHELLSQSSAVVRVKISDFGLARTADDASLSTSGLIAGTPMYMSPEQAQGGTLTTSSDLFSLGTVLYEMATGHPPFRAANVVAVLQRVALATPRAMTESIPELPAWFVAIVTKLHGRTPADRYRSAAEVAEVFATCETEWHQHGHITSIPLPEPVTNTKPNDRSTRQWVHSRRSVLLLSTFAVCVLIAGFWMNRPDRENILHSNKSGLVGEKADDATDNITPKQLDVATATELSANSNTGMQRSPDGRQIATCGADGTVRLWDVQSGALQRTIRLHPIMGLVMKVRFTPDGRHLWTRNGNGTLYVLRLTNR